MSISFNIKVKTGNQTVQSFTTKDGKQVAALIADDIKQTIVTVASQKILETVAQHNERVIMQAAIFFQRAVTRTPKDETYSRSYGGRHIADSDYVWKHWKMLYWGKQVTAEEFGERFFEHEKNFDNKALIKELAQQIKDRLFGGDERFSKRKSCIKKIRFENDHPRFAMLEYGDYQKGEPQPSKGLEHWHGVQKGYSVQAPYGMMRITLAEMEQMGIEEFDRWIKRKQNKSRVARVPSKSKMKELTRLIENKRHLTTADIEAVGKIYEGGE